MENVKASPFPIKTKKATGTVKNLQTDVTLHGFSDKILITIVQNGRLAQWYQVSLNTVNPTYLQGKSVEDEDGLLPLPHLTTQCLLGAGSQGKNGLGQLYAAQVASAIVMRDHEETRTLVLGLGLQEYKEEDADAFVEILGLVGECL